MLIDQLLTIFNIFQSTVSTTPYPPYRALARTCDCPLNDKTGGGSARKWTNSKPVRVVRNYKGRKSSEYAPEEGNRYDGIYKVVKYWPEKNKNGFIVWKYLFRRDDEVGTLQGKTVRNVSPNSRLFAEYAMHAILSMNVRSTYLISKHYTLDLYPVLVYVREVCP